MDELNIPRIATLTVVTLVALFGLKLGGERIAEKYDIKLVEEKKTIQLKNKLARLKLKKQYNDIRPVAMDSDLTLQPNIARKPSSVAEASGGNKNSEVPNIPDIGKEGTSSSVAGVNDVKNGKNKDSAEDTDEKNDDGDDGLAFVPTKDDRPSTVALKDKTDPPKTFTNVARTPTNSNTTPAPSPTISSASSAPIVTVTTNKPSGTYILQPQISLSSDNADSIKYCIGAGSGSPTCCDPVSAGVSYSGPFQPGTVDSNYCVSAIAYSSGVASAPYNWNYLVDATLISLNFTMPQRTVFQTQQLHDFMTVDSDEFGDSSLTFYQRASTTNPGAVACDILSSTTTANDMNSTLGQIINFGSVSAPFQIPLQLDNQLDYGVNYIVSIIERSISRAPAASDVEETCLQNTIEINDFHLEGVSASANQSFPADGSYSLQGGLNFISSFPTTGDSLGSNGIILEHGFINIIN